MGLMRTFVLLAAMTALFMAVGYFVGGAVGLMIAFVVAVGMNFYAYWNSDKVVLRMQGAERVDEQHRSPIIRSFVQDVHELAHKADMPVPAVYIMDTPQPNAFATGRDEHHAAVAATTGLLQSLNRHEVAGVMAHELAHVRNRDSLIMTITATFAGAIGMLASVAMFFGSRERGNMITNLLIMILAPVAASLVQMAISRSREYEADRVGAEICGNPLWLASALEKIERGARATIHEAAERNPSMAHMYIMNPLSGRSGRDNLFSTHPSTSNRVDALRQMAKDMGQVAQEPDREPAQPRGPWG